MKEEAMSSQGKVQYIHKTTNMINNRDLQVVAVGSKARKEAATVVREPENILKQIMGEGHGAKVQTFTEPARMGMITFDTIGTNKVFPEGSGRYAQRTCRGHVLQEQLDQ